MTLFLITPGEMSGHLAKRARGKRLALNLSQKTLSERSKVSLSVIKKFEKTGKISLQSLLKIALVLDALEPFKDLFGQKIADTSLETLLEEKERKRGRR
ncbi:helix-turn-helix domain-containing protein [Candidatus Neptunochlamydia vexilliferae]|nr:helix-turn-helix transcriptional regulator [Candidatus Neptunochlamydia vexilliferae]